MTRHLKGSKSTNWIRRLSILKIFKYNRAYLYKHVDFYRRMIKRDKNNYIVSQWACEDQEGQNV